MTSLSNIVNRKLQHINKLKRLGRVWGEVQGVEPGQRQQLGKGGSLDMHVTCVWVEVGVSFDE